VRPPDINLPENAGCRSPRISLNWFSRTHDPKSPRTGVVGSDLASMRIVGSFLNWRATKTCPIDAELLKMLRDDRAYAPEAEIVPPTTKAFLLWTVATRGKLSSGKKMRAPTATDFFVRGGCLLDGLLRKNGR